MLMPHVFVRSWDGYLDHDKWDFVKMGFDDTVKIY
jgi:hypothetical protein